MPPNPPTAIGATPALEPVDFDLVWWIEQTGGILDPPARVSVPSGDEIPSRFPISGVTVERGGCAGDSFSWSPCDAAQLDRPDPVDLDTTPDPGCRFAAPIHSASTAMCSASDDPAELMERARRLHEISKRVDFAGVFWGGNNHSGLTGTWPGEQHLLNQDCTEDLSGTAPLSAAAALSILEDRIRRTGGVGWLHMSTFAFHRLLADNQVRLTDSGPRTILGTPVVVYAGDINSVDLAGDPLAAGSELMFGTGPVVAFLRPDTITERETINDDSSGGARSNRRIVRIESALLPFHDQCVHAAVTFDLCLPMECS